MSYTPELNKPCTRNCKECTYTNLCFEKDRYMSRCDLEKVMENKL